MPISSRILLAAAGILVLSSGALGAQTPGVRFNSKRSQGSENPNFPFIEDPVLTVVLGQEGRLLATDQVQPPSEQVNVVGQIIRRPAQGLSSLRGVPITDVSSPQQGLRDSAQALEDAASQGDTAAMTAAAQEIRDILLGQTSGRIYDRFALLNFNQGGFLPEHVPGEYKLKVLQDTGEQAQGPDGNLHRVWEATVSMLWYDEQFDADTYLLQVPATADPFDVLRINYRVYSLVQENLSPTVYLRDHEAPGSEALPFMAFDSIWIATGRDTLTEVTVQHPHLGSIAALSVWGRRRMPSRLQTIRLVREIVNVHTGLPELDPEGQSLVQRTRALGLADVGKAAPEMKLLQVADGVLAGATPAQVLAAMENAAVPPLGRSQDWLDTQERHDRLPQEALDVLAAEGIPPGSFGPYRYVVAFANNEMYGDGPDGAAMIPWAQGDRFRLKVINLDRHTHYFQAWDFGKRLNRAFLNCDTAPGGGNSIEIASYKPLYGVPKALEVQWRAGWGFRTHLNVILQQNVFRRAADHQGLLSYADGWGGSHRGWLYGQDLRGGDFRFDPPLSEIGTSAAPSPFGLREADGSAGLLIGRSTPGYGGAQMCSHAAHPQGDYCRSDLFLLHPLGLKNVDLDSDGTPDVLWFPPHLRNPGAGGDIVPATGLWRPFLYENPTDGSLLADPADPGAGWWVDRTYSHGAPVAALESCAVLIEAPRSAGQALHLQDGLFTDNGQFRLIRDTAAP